MEERSRFLSKDKFREEFARPKQEEVARLHADKERCLDNRGRPEILTMEQRLVVVLAFITGFAVLLGSSVLLSVFFGVDTRTGSLGETLSTFGPVLAAGFFVWSLGNDYRNSLEDSYDMNDQELPMAQQKFAAANAMSRHLENEAPR